MYIREAPNGDVYVCRTPKGCGKKSGRRDKRSVNRNWFLVKQLSGSGVVHIRSITFPKSYLGKRIRLKIEVIK